MRFILALALTTAVLGGCSIFNADDHADDGPDGGTGATCSTAAQCAPGLVCAADVCIFPGTVGVGANCSANRDCSTGLQCALNGICSPAGGGAIDSACVSGADCMSTLRCQLDGFGGTCQADGPGEVGATCDASDDCLAGLACSSGGRCQRAVDAFPPYVGVTCANDESPFRIFFEVPRPGAPLADFYRLPFPNDVRVQPDGTLDLSDFPRPGLSLLGLDLVDLYADAAAEDFDGFASLTTASFRFSSALDFSTVQDGAALFIVDITDPGLPGYGANRSRAFNFDSGRGKFACQNRLTLGNRTTDPLEPGHTYAAWVSTAARSTSGATPIQDPDLIALLGATAPADATLARGWAQYAKFRTYLTEQSRLTTTVAAAAVFTVADASKLARKLAAEVEAAPMPTITDLTLCDGVAISPCAGADPTRACGDSSGGFWEIHGRLTVTNYQAGTLPYERPTDGGALEVGTDGNPVAQGTLSECFALTIPKGAAPAGGWPLVVHAHGTGGSYKAAIDAGIASTLAEAATPMATFTTDGVGHGARRGASARTPDSLVFNIVNPRAARDNHLQGAVDELTALRLPDLAPFAVAGVSGTIDFDAARTYYFGHSQGSNVGLPAVAVTSRAKGAIFSGAGSALVEGILGKKQPVDAKAGLELLLGEGLGAGHPVMILWQLFFDRIDPVNYAPMLIKRPPAGVASKHVWMSWGKGDSYSPELTLTATAAAAGLVVVEPQITVIGLPTDPRPIDPTRVGGDGQVRFGAVFQYDPAGAYDGHFVATRSPAAIADWRGFLTSLAAGAPRVP